MVLIERQQLWVANCVFMILLNGENYPVPARKSKVKYPTRPGKKYEIPDPLDTRKFQKMKYPTRSIPGKSLPDPSLVLNLAMADLLYCIINLPIFVFQKLNGSWDLGLILCKISSNIRLV